MSLVVIFGIVGCNAFTSRPFDKMGLIFNKSGAFRTSCGDLWMIKQGIRYGKRLWSETSPQARNLIAANKGSDMVRQLQSYIMKLPTPPSTRSRMLSSCADLLTEFSTVTAQSTECVRTVTERGTSGDNLRTRPQSSKEGFTDSASNESDVGGIEKKSRSVLFGVLMGVTVACWVFSGSYLFTGLFTLMTIIGQLEYYRMIISTGVYPARRISVVGACSMFLTALFSPELHQICLPLFGLWAMIWFLTMKRSGTSIPEIATTFTGMFYLGYVPSFWVRIRLLDVANRSPTRLTGLVKPVLDHVASIANSILPSYMVRSVHLPITAGSIFIFWTWLCIAFSDVGAYFVGRRFGKTKLGVVAPAAEMTSPNKTIEGVVGGCLVSGTLGMLGKASRFLRTLFRWTHFFCQALGYKSGLSGLFPACATEFFLRYLA